MPILTVASEANDALVLPAMLAATYLTQCKPDDAFSIRCTDVESQGLEKANVILVADDEKPIVDGSVAKHLLDQVQLPRGVQKNEVCFSTLSPAFSATLITS